MDLSYISGLSRMQNDDMHAARGTLFILVSNLHADEGAYTTCLSHLSFHIPTNLITREPLHR